MRSRLLRSHLLLLCLATPAFADYLEVSREADLHRRPEPGSPVVAKLEAGAALELLNSGTRSNGFYRARWTEENVEGWVYGNRVRRRPGRLDVVEPEPAAEGRSASLRAKRPARCGVERWAVKTLSDAAVDSVDFSATVKTSVDALNDLGPHCGKGPDARARPEERTVYEVVGRIAFAKFEPDRDVHLALEDADTGRTVIAEIVDPTCPGAKTSKHVEKLQAARGEFGKVLGDYSLKSLEGELVRVRGVGFFDRGHGQKGRAESCLELHPVLAIEYLEQ
jgi:hypothetical protein